jgi:hypothetical protein
MSINTSLSAYTFNSAAPGERATARAGKMSTNSFVSSDIYPLNTLSSGKTPLERILDADVEPMTCGNGTYTFSAALPG